MMSTPASKRPRTTPPAADINGDAMDIDDEEQVEVQRRNDDQTPTPHLPPSREMPDLSLYPSLKEDLEDGISAYKLSLKRIDAATASFNKCKLALERKDPPKSMLPNVVLNLPEPFAVDPGFLESRNLRYGMELLEHATEKRSLFLKSISNFAANEERIFKETLDAFHAKAPTAHQAILEKIGAQKLRNWFTHQCLLANAEYEVNQNNVKAEAAKKAELAALAQQRAETAPAEQLVGDVVDKKIMTALAPLMAQLQSIQELLRQTPNGGRTPVTPHVQRHQPPKPGAHARYSGQTPASAVQTPNRRKPPQPPRGQPGNGRGRGSGASSTAQPRQRGTDSPQPSKRNGGVKKQ